MSRYFDDGARRLRDAGSDRRHQPDERHPPRRRRMRRAHGPRRFVLVGLLALVVLAVPAALATVTDLWKPDVRPLPPMGTVGAIRGNSFSCRPIRGESDLHVDVGPRVGPEFTSVLGVLARPRTPADRIERRYLRSGFAHDIDVQGVRYLGTAPDGVRYYVIPAGSLGSPPPPASCLRKLPPRVRRIYDRQPRREPSICIQGGGGGGCMPLADIRRHGSWGASGVGGRSTVSGVVPNGVRAIRVTYGHSTRTFPVRDNFFAFRVALQAPQAVQPDRLVWELDDGTVRDVTRHPHPPPLRR